MKDKEVKRLAIEKAQIEALTEKHRPCMPKTPDKVSRLGTGKNAKVDGQEWNKKGKPPYKKAIKDIQIKKSCKKGKEAENAERGNTDTLLGDPMANTTTGTEKGQKDKIGIDDIGIFESIFHGLPELPELEGIDEDRLRELQNAIQEQLHQRDEERDRNITKRVQEFEKTFDFVNFHLLKGEATMAELTKTDNRQPMGKIKPTDKMVMMPSLFDGTKPATSKQHYERFNLYINFQTKSGHLTDPVEEAIDLFEHTLDKTALVWFQTNRSKFKDLTTLKMMFLQRYNPWGKTKREQLQSWTILSFNPKTTDVDEHIDLINTLGDMVDQKEEAKREKFIETMPTMIQTHLITCKDWAAVKDTAKSFEHIILKCDPPTPAMPMMATGATILGLYSHVAHSVDKEEGEITQLFKGAKPKQTRGRGKPKGKPQEQRHNPPKAQEANETTCMKTLITIIIMPQVRVEATDLIMVKEATDNLECSCNETEAKDLSMVNVSFKVITIRETHLNKTVLNTAIITNPIFREIKQIAIEAKAGAMDLSNSEDTAAEGPIIRIATEGISISITHTTHNQNNMAPPCSLCSRFNHSPKHHYKGEHDINNIMEKMSINPHQSQLNNLYQ